MKESQEDEFGPKRVFTINHSEIPKGITQCTMSKHEWKAVNETELACSVCPTQIIVSNEDLKQLTEMPANKITSAQYKKEKWLKKGKKK